MPEIDGYDVLAPLGSSGRSWKALSSADHTRVVLRRVHGGEQTRVRIRRDAAVWCSLPGAFVVPIRDVVTAVEGDLVVVTELMPGGGLDALLARRRGLTDGEMITLLVPLAETLAAAHARGLTHGRVSTGNVVFDGVGRPMFADAALLGSESSTVAADLADLASLGLSALADPHTGAVASVLAVPCSSAAELASALRTAAPARPIVVRDLPPVSVAATAPARSPLRRALRLVVAAAVAALVIGIAWGRHDTASGARLVVPVPTATPQVAAPTTTPSWPWIMQQLETARTRALARNDISTLADVDVVGSPAWRYDVAIVRAMTAQRLRSEGLRVHVNSVSVVSASAQRVVVLVDDRWTSYNLVTHDGRVIAHHDAQQHRDMRLMLARVGERWLVQQVRR